MKSNLYRRMERDTAAWDLTAGCRKYIFNNKSQRNCVKNCVANPAKQSTDSLTKTLLDKLQIP